MKRRLFLTLFCIFLACSSFGPTAPEAVNPIKKLTRPPLGWNSYDCWFYDINDSIVLNNLFAFEKKLKPAGYEYFVLDDQWQYGWDAVAGAMKVNIDSTGRLVPDPDRFPNGLQPYIDLAHSFGIKFGVWLIRGAPKKAISQNLKIKGTSIPFSEALDTTIVIDHFLNQSSWHGTSAFHNSKFGMQEYYNSVFELLAEWKIDFVKYDFIAESPDDMAAVIAARDRCGRDIVISFSPSCGSNTPLFPVYEKADMVRITTDIWDNRESLYKVYPQWELWQPYAHPGFWLDLDMIPFGAFPLYSRRDSFTLAQKETFMTQRALAASPLIMGGSLPESDSLSIALITDKDMLECNQNGVCGHLVLRNEQYEVWGTTSSADYSTGWAGIFNKNKVPLDVTIKLSDLGLDTTASYLVYDIWKKKFLNSNPITCSIGADGVLFICYRRL